MKITNAIFISLYAIAITANGQGANVSTRPGVSPAQTSRSALRAQIDELCKKECEDVRGDLIKISKDYPRLEGISRCSMEISPSSYVLRYEKNVSYVENKPDEQGNIPSAMMRRNIGENGLSITVYLQQERVGKVRQTDSWWLHAPDGMKPLVLLYELEMNPYDPKLKNDIQEIMNLHAAHLRKMASKMTADVCMAAPALASVDLSGEKITNADLDKLGKQGRIEQLKLGGTIIDDDGLSHIAALQLKSLDLFSTKVTDVGLHHLEKMKSLRNLDLSHTHITDKGIERLKGLGKLQSLNLNSNNVGNLEALKNLKSLQKLALMGSSVTDPDLENLKDLKQLQSLNLGYTSVSDEGLSYLNGLSQLHKLSLAGTAVTGAQLKQLNNLHSLDLSGSEIDNDGMENLKAFRQLQNLYLSHTEVDDSGLACLKGLKQLRTLDLTGTKVTDREITKLKKLLPKCQIYH